MSNYTNYYLRNKEAGFLGNAPMWWAKGGSGYTAYIDNAEKFNKKDAEKMVAEDPSKWEIFPCGLINQHYRKVFDWQDIRHVKKEMETINDNI